MEGCESCFAGDRCLKCEKDFFLDLQDYSCVKNSCPDGTIPVSFELYDDVIFKICRESGAYYIDGNSDEEVELGTIEYPFKRPYWATSELFNLRTDFETPVTFYFK